MSLVLTQTDVIPVPGCALIVAKSFARIHETNLKVSILFKFPVRLFTALQKQGILPLWFADKSDYSRISSEHTLQTVGLADLLQGKSGTIIKLKVSSPDGDVFDIETRHTMSKLQLEWLHAGSALTRIRMNAKSMVK